MADGKPYRRRFSRTRIDLVGIIELESHKSREEGSSSICGREEGGEVGTIGEMEKRSTVGERNRIMGESRAKLG